MTWSRNHVRLNLKISLSGKHMRQNVSTKSSDYVSISMPFSLIYSAKTSTSKWSAQTWQKNINFYLYLEKNHFFTVFLHKIRNYYAHRGTCLFLIHHHTKIIFWISLLLPPFQIKKNVRSRLSEQENRKKLDQHCKSTLLLGKWKF